MTAVLMVRFHLALLLMADEKKKVPLLCKWGNCERRRIKLGICAKTSVGRECMDIRIIAENDLKAREF